MSQDSHQELVNKIIEATDAAIWVLATRPEGAGVSFPEIECLGKLQQRYGREFPVLNDQSEFWETLWLCTDRVRQQWDRIEKLARRTGPGVLERLQPLLDEQRHALYQWARRFITEHAPVCPRVAHFELGISPLRPDCRGLHERLEGLYESVKRIGRFPTVEEGLALPEDRVNIGLIYGGGWNVSTFSVLREAAHFPGMNTFVAFDHAGADLFGHAGGRVVRLAPAGLVRRSGREGEEYLLATFRKPPVLHFAFPYQWTGTPPHELGLPILRSDLTLEIVDDKLTTSQALAWYMQTSGVQLPLPRERGIRQVPGPVDLDALAHRVAEALNSLEAEGVEEVVVKPSFGEQSQGVRYFSLSGARQSVIEYAVRLGLEYDVVIQERIRPPGGVDFDWRVLVALSPQGEPTVVGRFARRRRGEDIEMVAEREMPERVGITGKEAEALLDRLNEVSLHAFRAVAGYALARRDFPWRPLGGNSYALPYLLGIDLIGEARIMEINGHEVAGMWTDDRLYPETRGRCNRVVLESAQVAARDYQVALMATDNFCL
ncbi:MAG: hypothetical protein GXO98_06590 [Nitrospirae bacterium]|nr:hypothetical protein [Nitrospirota bacterium]